MNLRGLSIRQRMQAGFALVVMLTAVACGTNLRESYRQYRQGYLDLRDFALVERAMIASNRISAERWPANQLLALRWRDAATQVQAVRDARARSDQALDALRDDLARAEALGASERGAA
ncbi:sensor histidine kinase, partial [Burkholderia contaminans]|nr:sensor histidine kinase [Burkholderia contaminans]